MTNRTVLAIALGALAIAVGLLVGQPLASQAQPGAAAVAIAQGPGGVWIVRGDRVYVCDQSPIISRSSATAPATPQCGTPLTLP